MKALHRLSAHFFLAVGRAESSRSSSNQGQARQKIRGGDAFFCFAKMCAMEMRLKQDHIEGAASSMDPLPFHSFSSWAT